MSAGRPTNLTNELIDQITHYILDGNYRDVAARGAGVPLRTFRRWCANGKRDRKDGVESLCSELWHSVTEAENAAEITQVKRVMEASKEDPDHAWKWLERKFAERWGRQTHEISMLKKELAALREMVHGKSAGDAPRG